MEDKEAWERKYAADFLDLLGTRFTDLRSVSAFPVDVGMHVAGPDVKVRINSDSGTRQIGLELTRYSSDADAKGSVALHRASVRARLRQDLCRLLPNYPELDRFQISVRFRGSGDRLRPNARRCIAREIADLLGPKLAYLRQPRSFDPVVRSTVFNGYPSLQKHVACLDVYRNVGDYRGTSGWFEGCAFKWIGVRVDQVCRLIKRHDPGRYELDDVEECWLVIYSTGHAGSGAGTLEMARRSLSCQRIADAVAGSGFQRVYFWCREDQRVALLGSVVNRRGSESEVWS